MSDFFTAGADDWGDEVGSLHNDEPSNGGSHSTEYNGQTSTDADLELLLSQVDVSTLGKKPKPPPKPPPLTAPTPTTTAVQANPVELGFVSSYPDGPAQAWHFPSKVGGEPVWLLPERLPVHLLSCTAGCGRPLRFLLQLYCPRPEVPHAYHRSLMLFCCGGACLRSPGGWRAIRCNLPEEVPWYQEHQDGSWTVHGREQLLNQSTVGDMRTRADADAHSGSGSSRSAMALATPATIATVPLAPIPGPSLPELLISIDLEGDWRSLLAETDALAEADARRLLQAYEASEAAASASGNAAVGGAGACAASELPLRPSSAKTAERLSGGSAREDDDDLTAADEEDVEESFFAFQRRSSAHPQQALRYNREPGAEPLWAGTRGRLTDAPPCCARCGAPRTFEFQLMPQLLCELEGHGYEESLPASMLTPMAVDRDAASEERSDGLDWGVVAVYTCAASCATASGPSSDQCGYAEEFVWHQLIS